MKTIKKIYKWVLELMNVNSACFRIKEWYTLYHFNAIGHFVFLIVAPFIILFYPLLRLSYKYKLKILHSNNDIYELKKEPGTVFYIPKAEKDIMHNYYLLSDNYHDHNILPDLCRKYIKEGSVICDIGANLGNHSVYFAKHCSPKHIYAFEPVKETFDFLMQNIKINRLNNVIEAFNVALGTKEQKAVINYRDIKNCGANSIVEDEDGDVSIIPLDSMNLGKIDFFKIDVEGYEYEVIEGGRKTIKESDAVIFIEIFDENFDRVNRLLGEIGYEHVEDNIEKNRQDYIYIKSKKNI